MCVCVMCLCLWCVRVCDVCDVFVFVMCLCLSMWRFCAFEHVAFLCICAFEHLPFFEHLSILVCIWAFEHYEHLVLCIWTFFIFVHLSICCFGAFEHLSFLCICIWHFCAFDHLNICRFCAFEHLSFLCIWAFVVVFCFVCIGIYISSNFGWMFLNLCFCAPKHLSPPNEHMDWCGVGVANDVWWIWPTSTPRCRYLAQDSRTSVLTTARSKIVALSGQAPPLLVCSIHVTSTKCPSLVRAVCLSVLAGWLVGQNHQSSLEHLPVRCPYLDMVLVPLTFRFRIELNWIELKCGGWIITVLFTR